MQKIVTTTTTIDYMTGEPADVTVRFGWNNRCYEIDLTETNAATMWELMEPYGPGWCRCGPWSTCIQAVSER